MTRKQLMENVYLTYLPSEKFKTSFLSAQIVVPLCRETASRNALLVNVLSRGTERFPDMAALGRRLDMLYGARLEASVRKRGENQLFGFVASCVDDQFLPTGEKILEPLAELMGEMLCRPALQNGSFREDYVAGERENLAELIRSDVNDKRAYAARRLIEELCVGEPYGVGRLGTAQDTEAITAADLDAHYRSILPRGRLELFCCGRGPEERVEKAFRRAFAALPRGEAIAPARTLPHPARRSCRVVTEELEVSQGKLCIGFRISSEDKPAAMLMNAMFGGVTTSKLFLNVREKLSLCYYADSAYHRFKGLVTVSAGIRQTDYDRALEEIFAQLEAMKRGDWADWELESARRNLLSSLRSMEDSAGAMEDFLLGQAASGREETVAGLMEDLRSVTAERVRSAAETVELDTIYFLKGKEEDV